MGRYKLKGLDKVSRLLVGPSKQQMISIGEEGKRMCTKGHGLKIYTSFHAYKII